MTCSSVRPSARLWAAIVASLLFLSACGWPPYDIEASSSLNAARDMELVLEFRVADGDGGGSIVRSWRDPDISFYPSLRLDPQGSDVQLGLFLVDSALDSTDGQFFDLVRDDSGAVETLAVESDQFWLPRGPRVYFYQMRYPFEDGPDTVHGDVFITFIPWGDEYDVVSIYADPTGGTSTNGSVLEADGIFWRQRNAIDVTDGWASANLGDVVPVAVGVYHNETEDLSYVISLFIDEQTIRLVQTELDINALDSTGVDFDDSPELRDDLDGPAPNYTADFSVGRLAVRDIASPTESTRIAVSLLEPEGTHAVFLGTYDGTVMNYARVPGLTDPVIEVLSTGLLITRTANGYRIVTATGNEVWSVRSSSLLFTGEREHEGRMYLYFSSGYWGREDGNQYRFTRVNRIRTPQP